MRIKKKNQRFHWFMLLPACLFLVVFLLAPLVMMLVLSFRDVDSMMNTLQTYSFSQYIHVFTTDAYVKAIGSTVGGFADNGDFFIDGIPRSIRARQST